ncbi:BTAD domain-containing putative transcriptional regulator [Amycolatopsis speibonae]|uniref:BTAD domain-containing putative transcriptional regulator n=1 Tax=Amycolatopsis speibonae TaxID=1450224 RepID=A0ABV7P2A1_9PSEU
MTNFTNKIRHGSQHGWHFCSTPPEAQMRLRLDLFGPVRAWRGSQEVVLGSAQRRTLLAVLALHANQVVTRTELIDAIWGEKAPSSANGSIYTYISSLRSALDPERTRREAAEVLASSGAGYCLRVDAESIDVVRFENLRERARMCQRGQDTAGALSALDKALALFRDDPMAGLTGPFATTQRERLQELRLDAVERRAKLMLDTGEHQQVLADLHPFAAAHPMREGLQSLHLLALYRCGQRNEALRVFEGLQANTIEELGIEPGADLTHRYEQIRVDDPALWRKLACTPRPSITARPPQVDPPALLVGRSCELASIRTSLSRLANGHGSSLWLEGELGIGKSALIASGLANVVDCEIAMASADEPGQRVPLRLILDCLSIGTNSPDPRRREAARAIRHISPDDDEALLGAVDLIVDLVIDLCREHPIILVMDDLHWADPKSLLTWQRLATECTRAPLLLIGVSRRMPRDHQLNELRSKVAKTGTCVHKLSTLSSDEVHDLLAGLTGAAPGPALLELGRTAAGNPLFVQEIVRALGGNEAPEPVGTDGRPAIPQTALDALNRQLGFLSSAASEVLRWAALLDRYFTHDDLAAALGRPAEALNRILREVEDVGLVVRSRGKLTFKHPVIREALYARTPTSIRLALHRQLAETLASAGAPMERVASQLLAAPIPVDKWICEWLAREVYNLAGRVPLSAMRLLQKVNTSGTVPPALREDLGVATARIMLWLERDLTTEAGQVAARTKNPDVVAEMRWLLAYSRVLRGDVDQAARKVKEALRDHDTPAHWRPLHEALLSRTRVEWWPVCTSEGAEAVARIPAQRTSPKFNARDSYWLGRWDDPPAELTHRLCGGPTLALHTLGHPTALRQLSGVAAAIAAHRGSPEDARTHLMSIWALAPAGEFGTDGTDFIIATNALLAEMQNRPTVAFSLLASMLEVENGAVCPWMPSLVRLAVDLDEHDHAKLATVLCERTPGQEAAALRCRALLDGDPTSALTAAAQLRVSGNRFGEAQAMEDAAALLARSGKMVKAGAALYVALSGYDELGAVLDARRAKQRVATERQRTIA